LLFLILIADVEEFMKRRGNGGAQIEKKRIFTLAYADDLAALATEEDELKRVLKSLEKYFREKEMSLNMKKSKVLVFSRKDRNKKGKTWKWKETLEEVDEFKYLGYTFKRNNSDEAHIKEVIKKAAGVMAQIWGIGERKFGGDWGRRLMMFNILVKSIFMYGVEVWNWEEREKLEKLQARYIRWTLGLERCTPIYVVQEETKVEPISIEAGQRALKYQEKIRNYTENRILKECK